MNCVTNGQFYKGIKGNDHILIRYVKKGQGTKYSNIEIVLQNE